MIFIKEFVFGGEVLFCSGGFCLCSICRLRCVVGWDKCFEDRDGVRGVVVVEFDGIVFFMLCLLKCVVFRLWNVLCCGNRKFG